MRRSSAPAALAIAAVWLVACASFAPELGPIRGAGIDGSAPASDDATAGGETVGDDAASDDGGFDATAADTSAAGDGTSGVDSPIAAEAGPSTWTVLVGANGTHSFGPSTLAIRAGDTVHWVWQQSGHTVSSGTGGVADGLFCSPSDGACSNAPTSPAGATYDHVFTAPGTYPYYCRLHWDSGMVGSITVQ